MAAPVAVTERMPLASMSNLTSTCGTPRGAGGIPSRRKLPSDLLSLTNSRSPARSTILLVSLRIYSCMGPEMGLAERHVRGCPAVSPELIFLMTCHLLVRRVLSVGGSFYGLQPAKLPLARGDRDGSGQAHSRNSIKTSCFLQKCTTPTNGKIPLSHPIFCSCQARSGKSLCHPESNTAPCSSSVP